jgi:hypothetical protein
MAGFAVNPPRTALIDSTGAITPEWYRYFVAIQRTVGGPSSPFEDAVFLGEPPAPARDIGAAWPVGAVFISTVETNPLDLLGFGTWQAFGAGRVMVGQDSGDTDFDTAEETGGAKTVAAAGTISGTAVADHAHHTHTVTGATAVQSGAGTDVVVTGATSNESPTLSHSVTQGTFAGSATSVVQPYIVVYMWKRIA